MKTFPILLTLCLIIPNTWAQVILDGSLGHAETLTSPHYLIQAELGQTLGNNLFHSFQEFNLHPHETATFSGPIHINNIITRVTGGNPSNINGLIQSTIPNAEIYLINPFGILLGPHAKLDLQGSFHASTADYLRFQTGAQFNTRDPNNNLLNLAPIAAFGFLTETPAPIALHNSQLTISPHQTLSLIGGNLHIHSEVPLTIDNTLPIPTVTANSTLIAEHGQINLASLAGPGEFIINEDTPILQGPGGHLTLENTFIELSGYTGGAAFVRAGHLLLNQSVIRSNTFGPQDGRNIDLQLTKSILLTGINSEISITTASTSTAGKIVITTPLLEMNASTILGIGIAEGEAGTIDIQADQLRLTKGASIGSGALGSGNSGQVSLHINDKTSISGFYPGLIYFRSLPLENVSSRIYSISLGPGRSGHLQLTTKELSLNTGNILTIGFGTGGGGDITINAQSIRSLNGSLINSFSALTGPSGNIKIKTEQLYLAGWSPVASTSVGRNWGIVPATIDSGTLEAGGRAGMIDIQADNITLSQGAIISARNQGNSGDAGDIRIEANTLQLTEGGTVSTSSNNADSGEIHLTAHHLLYLRGGKIITSVLEGEEDGGDILIANPKFIIIDQAQIKAQAHQGRGGNIWIVAGTFLKTPDSLITASSKLGIDGRIYIDSPDKEMNRELLGLSTQLKKTELKLTGACQTQYWHGSDNPSSFYVHHLAGTSLPLLSWLPSPTFQLAHSLSKILHTSYNISETANFDLNNQRSWLTSCY